jgi:hypothetical protein
MSTDLNMASKSIILKNGTFLLHDNDNRVTPTVTSLLIQNGKIVTIAHDIEPSKDAEIIDCTDKLISPGFVDTHHHGWQTQLKGRHANEQLLDYMVTGKFNLLYLSITKQAKVIHSQYSTRPKMSSMDSSPACSRALQPAQQQYLTTRISPVQQNTQKSQSLPLHRLAFDLCLPTHH